MSILGGVLNGLGALTSFAALESGGKASIVISLISLYPLLTVAAAVLFLHERLTPLQALGAVLAIVAAILLSIEAPPAAADPESQKPSSGPIVLGPHQIIRPASSMPPTASSPSCTVNSTSVASVSPGCSSRARPAACMAANRNGYPVHGSSTATL